MVQAYMLSLLTRQLLMVKERFASMYPNAWLVWEPGTWRAPPASGGGVETISPTMPGPDKPGEGDALCFELKLPKGKTWLLVGRAESNDLVINDATVSREHLILMPEQGQLWLAQAGPLAKDTVLWGKPLEPGASVRLTPGAQMRVGNVVLTYYDTTSFVDRVRAAAIQPAVR